MMKPTVNQENIGRTIVRTVGTANPLVIVHGGPGLDHTYLVEWLAPLATLRKLIFYDQLGCGEDRTPIHSITATRICEQLAELLREIQRHGPVGVFTHSWGSYILYQALRSDTTLAIREAILSNPVGLTRDRFDESGDRLLGRIPPHVLEQIAAVEHSNGGVRVMEAALPYYTARSDNLPLLTFGFYDPAIYNRVIETLGSYDCRDIGGRLPSSTLLVYGEKDIELPAATREIHPPATLETIEDAGHFPFAEQPQRFLDVLETFLRRA